MITKQENSLKSKLKNIAENDNEEDDDEDKQVKDMKISNFTNTQIEVKKYDTRKKSI